MENEGSLNKDEDEDERLGKLLCCPKSKNIYMKAHYFGIPTLIF